MAGSAEELTGTLGLPPSLCELRSSGRRANMLTGLAPAFRDTFLAWEAPVQRHEQRSGEVFRKGLWTAAVGRHEVVSCGRWGQTSIALGIQQSSGDGWEIQEGTLWRHTKHRIMREVEKCEGRRCKEGKGAHGKGKTAASPLEEKSKGSVMTERTPYGFLCTVLGVCNGGTNAQTAHRSKKQRWTNKLKRVLSHEAQSDARLWNRWN